LIFGFISIKQEEIVDCGAEITEFILEFIPPDKKTALKKSIFF